MNAGPPHQPRLVSKLWLALRFGRASKSAAPGHAAVKPMSLESLEHIVRSRVRIFLRHTWLATILGTIVLGGGIWAAIYLTTRPTVMRIAAGPSDSANATFVQTLSKRLRQDRDRIQLQIVPTNGPKESAQAMADGGADLAILPSTVGNAQDWPVVAILRQNVMALIVPATAANAIQTSGEKPISKKTTNDAASTEKAIPARKAKRAKSVKADTDAKPGKTAKMDEKTAENDTDAETDKTDKSTNSDETAKLEKVTQLTGRRIGIVTGNVATPELLDIVLKHYGVPVEKVAVSLIDPKNLADAIRAEQVDAIFVAGAATGQAMTDAVAAAAQNGQTPSFIAIDQADGIAKRNPAFDPIDIDAGTFGGNPPSPDDSLKSLSFAEYLVARKSLSHDSIAALARLIYSSRLALAAAMPGEIKIAAPATAKDATVAVHPGALAYLNDDQKSFFDKYGDDIFYGLLIFPLFGSAVAAVATYFRNSHRTRRLRLLQRLLDLVRKAHTAPSLEALDQMQVEVENLVVAIIHQGEHEEYDQTMQMSFSLALDQVRFVIAARRADLIDRGGSDSKAAKFAAA